MPMPGEVDDVEVVTRTDAVEDALVHGGHHLAVPEEHPVGTDDQQRVVERPGAVVLALVDADGQVHAALAARRGQLRHERPADVDA